MFDPDLARRVFANQADDHVSYLFGRQLLEADIVCATKSDLHPEEMELPPPFDFRLSARTGEGVETWLEELLSGRRVAGARSLDVDYDRYAETEAAMGWLDLHAQVRLRAAVSPAVVVGPLLEQLDESLTADGIPIAHLKVFDRASSGYIKASICANTAEPSTDGDLLAEPAPNHELIVNMRALADPARLEQIVREGLSNLNGTVQVRFARAFRPGRPEPEYRYRTVVS